jgi:hypothetical protein
MTPDEFEGVMRAFRRRRIRPVVVEFTSGDRLIVAHPEALVRHGTLFVYVHPDQRRRVFAGSSVCQVFDPELGAT